MPLHLRFEVDAEFADSGPATPSGAGRSPHPWKFSLAFPRFTISTQHPKVLVCPSLEAVSNNFATLRLNGVGGENAIETAEEMANYWREHWTIGNVSLLRRNLGHGS